jgi:hypothetical protein
LDTKRIGLPGEQFNFAAKTMHMVRKYIRSCRGATVSEAGEWCFAVLEILAFLVGIE